ncbi:hypothetical protein I6A60_29325 [Frankia sp. AgB1.9]|nr:hypothetical protein [Frankia sp. AgW1.1]MBL7551931.1 hypothetical protein [Frankia sp. AgB1.9]MBL7623230.1 hypothetical protein [Frankia sp. AgB1.8]
MVSGFPTAALLTPAAQQAGRDALGAYRGMWADWVAVAATSDYQDPRLAQHLSGAAFSMVYKAVYLNKSQGLVGRGQPTLSPRVTAATPADNPTRITVIDCTDDSQWLRYTLDGKPKDDTPGGRHLTEALLLQNAGVWKVDQLLIQEIGTC